MKCMVSGIGGVGGYIAAVLCSHRQDVTLIARGKRRESLAKKGLVVHSRRMGEHIFHPFVTATPAAAGRQDVIFICVKNYSLSEALAALQPCIAEQTIIVPVLNGIDHYDVTKKQTPQGRVLDSLIYITTAYDTDYSIRQTSDYAKLCIGKGDSDALETVRRLLDETGVFDCQIPDDMDAEAWHKYIINCAYNVITAYYDATTGDLLQHPQWLKEFHDLLEETHRVGVAAGIRLSPSLPDEIYRFMTDKRNAAATSSMARDFKAKRANELETFSGHVLKKAAELHLTLPVTTRFYAELKKRSASF